MPLAFTFHIEKGLKSQWKSDMKKITSLKLNIKTAVLDILLKQKTFSQQHKRRKPFESLQRGTCDTNADSALGLHKPELLISTDTCSWLT